MQKLKSEGGRRWHLLVEDVVVVVTVVSVAASIVAEVFVSVLASLARQKQD